MAVNLQEPDILSPVQGVTLAAVSAGIYPSNRTDLGLLAIQPGALCSAVFTQNKFCAAPVTVAKNHISTSETHYCIVNSGNANAGTGERGIQDVNSICEALTDKTDSDVNNILPFSTGVIGEYMPVDKIIKAIPGLLESLSEDNWLAVARAMMTTDTIPKGVSRLIKAGSETITVTGIAKGAGMIKPDMATMLAFIATDAQFDQSRLDSILSHATAQSFNRISIDGDTSTNDACLLIATGASSVSMSGATETRVVDAITDVCIELAQSIVRDGEGATKFVSIKVTEGSTDQDCLEVAYTLAHSPLVKTALFASDPNWGRILAAVGRSPVNDLDISKISIYINELCVIHQGGKSSSYTEAAGKLAMSENEIQISISLAAGECEQCIWTSDLSCDYVRINAEYRT